MKIYMAGIGDIFSKFSEGVHISLFTIQLPQKQQDKISKKKKLYENYRKIEAVEIKSLRMYVNAKKEKVYTENIYTDKSYGYGIEMKLVNNTRNSKQIDVGCCVYDSDGIIRYKKNSLIEIKPKCTLLHRFYVNSEEAKKLEKDRYKLQIWMNNQKIGKKYFNIL